MAIGKTKSVADAHDDGSVVKYFGLILFSSFEKPRNVFCVFCVGTLLHNRETNSSRP
jgi:hypothetical protein